MYHPSFRVFITLLLLFAFIGQAVVFVDADDKSAGETQAVGTSAKLTDDAAHTKQAGTEQHEDCCDGSCDPSCNVDCSDGACICSSSMCSATLYLTAFIRSPATVFVATPIYSYQFPHTYFIANSLYRPPISAT
ncbi:hypothetical protein DXX93_06880 [Thalassotalea euphylliae]|uniref:CopL family metal-binding regulatory protein n=1 Tax=Thalassotalea euphylliae TaxID=1655234 RepID=A0A3E0TPQ2_9GAMM|nr:hypothetical protein [Thalassotalea euphylliae]REL26327.1 hypothetical protein DXX93_06880 [Thalassotalea euphylliae]